MLAGCVEQSVMLEQPTEASSITIWEARRTVTSGLRNVLTETDWASMGGAGDKVTMHPQSIRVTAGSIEFEVDLSTWGSGTEPNPRTLNCKFDLKNIGSFGVTSYRSQYWLTINGRDGRGCKIDNQTLAWATAGEAQAFAAAVNRLRASSRGEDLEYYSDAAWREFQVQATAWRALSVKPVIKEDVRKHRLLAENAVKEKQFDSAVEEYEAGLQIDPVWPEGHFNAALLCAELGYYPEAIHHMRAYLELVPDAPDAQRARDQLMIWEARLTKRR
jgi:hypothetical protein